MNPASSNRPSMDAEQNTLPCHGEPWRYHDAVIWGQPWDTDLNLEPTPLYSKNIHQELRVLKLEPSEDQFTTQRPLQPPNVFCKHFQQAWWELTKRWLGSSSRPCHFKIAVLKWGGWSHRSKTWSYIRAHSALWEEQDQVFPDLYPLARILKSGIQT